MIRYAGYSEPLLRMLSSMAAKPVSGLAGIVTANPSNVDRVQNALTYDPRTQEGIGAQNSLNEMISMAYYGAPGLSQSVDYFNQSADYLGEESPFAGAALRTLPELVASVIPAAKAVKVGKIAKGASAAKKGIKTASSIEDAYSSNNGSGGAK